MLLNDADIRRLCRTELPPGPMIEPFSEAVSGNGVISHGLTSAGYDLSLGSRLLVFKASHGEPINPKRFGDKAYRARMFDEVVAGPVYGCDGDNAFLLPAHSYVLGVSVEFLRIPRHLKGRVVGKSTLARCGVIINCTPLEPGWSGHLTIEISNVAPCPAVVYAFEGVAQLEFETLTSPPDVDYDQKRGKYQSQGAEPVAARML